MVEQRLTKVFFFHFQTPPLPLNWSFPNKQTFLCPTFLSCSTFFHFLLQQVLSLHCFSTHREKKKRNANDILAGSCRSECCGHQVCHRRDTGLRWSCPTWAWAAAKGSTALCAPRPGKGTWGEAHTGPPSPRRGTWSWRCAWASSALWDLWTTCWCWCSSAATRCCGRPSTCSWLTFPSATCWCAYWGLRSASQPARREGGS